MGIGGALLRDNRAGFDDALLKLGRNASRVALHDDLGERLQAVRNFQRGIGLLLRDEDAEGQRAGAGGEGGAEVFEAQLGERDLLAGDGFAQREQVDML